jgi:signal transduction histidine kinase
VHADSLYPRFLELCEEIRSTTGLRCELAVRPEHLSFRSDLGDVIFRTVRELLANVRKHARASTVHISSERRPDGDIAISIEDDGIGFRALNRDPNSFGSGFWLRGIDQRLGAFGALLDLDGGTGLRATVVVPGRLLLGHR